MTEINETLLFINECVAIEDVGQFYPLIGKSNADVFAGREPGSLVYSYFEMEPNEKNRKLWTVRSEITVRRDTLTADELAGPFVGLLRQRGRDVELVDPDQPAQVYERVSFSNIPFGVELKEEPQ